MTRPHTTQIQLDGREAALAADNRALYRFQEQGGRLDALFDLGRSYLHSIRLLWAILDAETHRRRFKLLVHHPQF